MLHKPSLQYKATRLNYAITALPLFYLYLLLGMLHSHMFYQFLYTAVTSRVSLLELEPGAPILCVKSYPVCAITTWFPKSNRYRLCSHYVFHIGCGNESILFQVKIMPVLGTFIFEVAGRFWEYFRINPHEFHTCLPMEEMVRTYLIPKQRCLKLTHCACPTLTWDIHLFITWKKWRLNLI